MKKGFLSIIVIFFLFVFSLGIFALTTKGIWGNYDSQTIESVPTQAGSPFESSHERSPYGLLLSLVENQGFQLSPSMAKFGSPDVGYVNGKFFSYFPVGVPLMLVPFFVYGQQYNLSLLFAYGAVSLFSSFTLILFFLIAKQVFNLSTPTSLLLCIIYAFATTSWSYSVTIYQHVFTNFFLFLSFYMIWLYKDHKISGPFWAVIAWVAMGLSFFIDYPNLILVIPLICYFFLRSVKFEQFHEKIKIKIKLTFLITSLVFLMVNYVHLSLNYQNFGDWKKLSNTLPRYDTNQLDKKGTLPVNISNTSYETKIAKTFQEQNIANGSFELLVAPDKGLFFFSPILILGLVGIYMKRKDLTLEDGTLIALVIMNFMLYASFGDPYGGWAFGPRYLIPEMAVLSLFIGIFLERFKYVFIGRLLLLILFVFSSAIALLGALTTNAVPPKIEADYLHLKYGFFYNIDYLLRNQSGSFLYNNYLSTQVSLQQYYLLILSSLVLITFILLCFIPRYKNNHES